MSSVLVHIYQRDAGDNAKGWPEVFGLVVSIDNTNDRAFTSKDEHGAILISYLNLTPEKPTHETEMAEKP